MKRTYFHGTGAANLQSILENGLSCHESKIWGCSHDAVYLWDVESLAEFNGCEDDELEYKEQAAFIQASQSGQFACSVSIDCRVVVLKIELDDSEVEIDDSYKTMGYARCIRRDVLPSEIVGIHVSNDLSLIRGYFIGLASSNDLCDIYFTRMEEKIGKAMLEVLDIEDVEDLITFEMLEVN